MTFNKLPEGSLYLFLTRNRWSGEISLRFLLICLFPMILIGFSSAQTIIKGTVVNGQNRFVQDVLVTLQTENEGSIVGYAYTNEKGFYQQNYTGHSDSLIVSVTGFNVKKQSKRTGVKNQTLNFRIEEKDFELREVLIKSKKIWGGKDTINYLVSGFSNPNDRVIGDVLRKMPGIEVKEDGEIKYNGKTINKFYIENLDLLQGRYGIATNNIQAGDVLSVQVLENHQPIKAMDKMEISTQPAINLKLKEGAKGTLGITAQLGVGAAPVLWDNEMNSLYFGKGMQNMSTFKGNNSGNDVTKELTSFTKPDDSSEDALITVRMPSPPEIRQSRYLFNNSNAFTFNNLLKLGKDKQMNVNVIYLNDYQKQESYSLSSYFLSQDSILRIVEDAGSGKNIDRLETDIHYTLNNDRCYFDNLFSVQAVWQNETGHVNADVQPIYQRLDRPAVTVSNTLHLVSRKNETHSFDIYSYNEFKYSPQELYLSPGLYDSFFSVDNTYNALRQRANFTDFRSENSLSLFSFGKNYFIVKLNGKINAEIQHLNSNLDLLTDQGVAITANADSLINNLEWKKYTFGLVPQFNYSRTKLKMSLTLPVSCITLNINDKQLTDKQTYHRTYVNPNFTVQYKAGFKTEINFRYSFANQMGTIKDLTTGYMLTDYRNLNRFSNTLIERITHQLSLDWAYKDVLSMFFCSAGIHCDYYGKNVLLNEQYIGNASISSRINRSNCGELKLVNGQLSKGFDFLNTIFILKGNYGWYSSEQVSQSKLYNYQNTTAKIDLSTNLTLSDKVSTDLSSSWGEISGKVENRQAYQSVRSLSNVISFTILLSKGISLKVNGEHYFNSAIISSSRQNKYFADTELNLKLKTTLISLSLTNIFNTKQYITSSFTDLNSFYYAYRIRPANLLLKIKFKIK